jgi:hypothetical protein
MPHEISLFQHVCSACCPAGSLMWKLESHWPIQYASRDLYISTCLQCMLSGRRAACQLLDTHGDQPACAHASVHDVHHGRTRLHGPGAHRPQVLPLQWGLHASAPRVAQGTQNKQLFLYSRARGMDMRLVCCRRRLIFFDSGRILKGGAVYALPPDERRLFTIIPGLSGWLPLARHIPCALT